MSPGAPRRRALPHRVAAILVALRVSLGFSGGAMSEPVHIGRMAAGDSGMVSEVLVADEVPLREAIEKGGTVTLSFDGMLNLTRPLVIAKDVVLDATGHQVLLSGNQQVRVLEVQPDVRLTLRNVTIAHGRSDRGGGLFNDGGSITLVDCVFTNNRAIGTPGTNGAVLPHTTDPILPETLVGGWGGPGLGGAILSRGALRASNCVFIANLAEGGAGGSGGQVLPTPTGSWSMTEPRWKDGTQGFGGQGGEAWGGAIHQETGVSHFIACQFLENGAMGGAGGAAPECQAAAPGQGAPGGDAEGGAMRHAEGYVEFEHCVVRGNQALGGRGGGSGVRHLTTGTNLVTADGLAGGVARGGALALRKEALILNSHLADNQAIGGDGGDGGTIAWGDNGFFGGGSSSGGAGGPGGEAEGGGLWNNGTMRMEACTLALNRAESGRGGRGGPGPTTSMGSFGPYNPLVGAGGPGGPGGQGLGGGLFNRGTSDLLNITVARNAAKGGPGGAGGPGGGTQGPKGLAGPERGGNGGTGGSGQGGGIANAGGVLTLTHGTLTENSLEPGSGGMGGPGMSEWYVAWSGSPGTPGDRGSGGAIQNRLGTVHLSHSIVTHSLSAANFGGDIHDAGRNLSSDSSVVLEGNGSLTNTDPKVGALGDYGGPTPTVPLLAGSPALDAAGSDGCPPLDQRGHPRPRGPGCDIGAVEADPMFPQEVRLLPPTGIPNLGRTVTVTLEVHNPNASLVLSNLHGWLDLPAGVERVEGAIEHRIPLLFGGETYRAQIQLRIVQLGDFPVVATFDSSILGDRDVVGGFVLRASGPPEILTSWARWDTDGTARFEASILPNGNSTTAWFRYGAETTLGSIAGSGSDDGGFMPRTHRAIPVGSAPPGGWHYQSVVSNAYGIVEGPLQRLPPPTVVQTASEEALRTAVAAGGYLRLDFHGSIPLTQTLVVERNTVLDASGRDVTLSGHDRVRVLELRPGVELTLLEVQIVGGWHHSSGGGLLNQEGTVRVIGGRFADNRASGLVATAPTHPGTGASGGAIDHRGLAYLESVRFENNLAAGGHGSFFGEAGPASGGPAEGGAMLHQSGTLILDRCLLRGNRAQAGSNIEGQARWGYAGSPGPSAEGGALLQRSGRVMIVNTEFSENTALASNGGQGQSVAVSFDTPFPGLGGAGGNARGAALMSLGELRLEGVLLLGNHAQAGNGGAGGYGSYLYGDRQSAGGMGGSAQGAAVFASNGVWIANSTLVSNLAVSGTGGLQGGIGNPSSAGLNSGAALHLAAGNGWLVNLTCAGNSAPTTTTQTPIPAIVRLANSLIHGSVSETFGSGPRVDLGGNLTSDPRHPFPTLTSRSGADPRMLPLADNGGPTRTMALAPNSPAIDAGADVFAPGTDQRGFPRPSGPASDVGAYEVQATPLPQSATARLRPEDGAVVMRFVVWPNRRVALETTLNWRVWTAVQTNTTSAQGVFEGVLPPPHVETCRFYRLRLVP